MLTRGQLSPRERFALLTSLTVVLAVSPVASGATEGGRAGARVDVSEILARLRHESAPAALAGAASRQEALAGILGGSEWPGACATPLLLALQRPGAGLPESVDRLLDRLGPIPARIEHRLLASAAVPAAGSARLRYTTVAGIPGAVLPEDGDLDGVPDEARRILSLFQEARTAVLSAFDQTATRIGRADATEPVHEIEVTDLPGRIGAWIWLGRGAPILMLDREQVLSPEGPAILRHQVAHLLQLALSTEEAPWWYEAHAAWAEDPLGADAGRRREAVAAYIAESQAGLGSAAAPAWEGAFLWPHYLVASGAPLAVGAAWDEMAAVPGDNTLEALDSAAGRIRGTRLADEVRAFRVWNLFLGDLDDGAHYPFGSLLPSAVSEYVRARIDAPAEPGAVAPLGASFRALSASPAPGGWSLEFNGDPAAAWDLTLVTIPARLDSGPRLAPVEIEEGRAAAAIPWRDLAAVIVLVQNLAGDPSPARYSVSAPWDPLVPMDLMSFTAEPAASGIAVTWSTEAEKDLAGWRLLRSRDPISGFAPVSSFLIPATGGAEGGAYVYLDSEARPGRKYYYLLEAVTRLGFTDLSHPAAVRVPTRPADGAR